MEFSIQRTGIYKQSDQSHTMSARDYKDATDLIICEGNEMHSKARRLTPLERDTPIVDRHTNDVSDAYQHHGWRAGETCDPLAAEQNNTVREDTSLVKTTYGMVSYGEYREGAGSLRAKGGDYGGGSESIALDSVVRRLTPLECERLQGFPDGWTDIGEWTDSKEKKHAPTDSPRYKALGNSIALPFWKVLARRIAAQYDRDITMGSLFDGIGGFPLAFEHCGAKAVWASEIEEFPIAVTKRHFPEVDEVK